MAVKRRLKFYSGIRLDIPHLRSFESAVSYDFDSTLRGVLTGINNPYVVKGFDIAYPIGLQAVNLQLKVADSVILHSTASESGTIMQVPQTAPDEILNALNPNVIGSFQNGVINYVALDYRREVDEESVDQTAGWSPSEKLEFQRTVPISTILQYKIVITSSGFGNLLPLYIVGVNSSGFVTFITNSKPSLFRLGSGGANPNPFASFTYNNLTNPQTGNRREFVYQGSATTNPVSVGPGDDSNAFNYGDWSIGSLKEWMDAVMTRFKEVTGSSYWYVDSNLPSSPSNGLSLANVWFDSGAGSVMTGAGNVAYNYILQADLSSDWSYGQQVKSGDSYIKGMTSGATAILNNVISDANYDYLLVTDVVGSFDYTSPETIQNRRLLKHNPNLFELITITISGQSYGLYQRKPVSTATTVAGTLASGPGTDEYTVTSGSHGLNNGDIVCIIGVSNKKVVQVANKTVNTFKFKTKTLNGISAGAITLAKVLSEVDQTIHPYPTNYSSGSSFNLNVEGASPDEYNSFDVNGNAYSSVEFWYPLEYTGTIPTPIAATGPIVFDGVTTTATLSIASELPSGATSNPYNGPVSWDSDIYIKGIVGDRYFKIPAAASADPAGTADIYGNGTAYLENGEVAYVVLERNQPVSISQLFSCSVAGGPISGSTPPLDVNGNPLVAGDFVKFANESDQYWLRIDSIAGNTINLINDAGGAPTALQRPANSGVLLYSKGSYSTVYVRPHAEVEDSINTYWLAVRRDFAGVSKVYFRSLELEPGEKRTINDNQPSNLLIYTGAGTEAATSPDYTEIDNGQWSKTQSLNLQSSNAVHQRSKQVSFASAPDLGFQKGDKFKTSGGDTYTVDAVLTNKTVLTKEDPASLVNGQTVTYYRLNYSINESDNLTLAIRKEDRELARVNTRLTKPVYDESVFLQVMPITLSPGQTLRSGSFVYIGSINAPTSLAWVLYGSSSVNETIEGSAISMPGGNVFGSNTALVHIYSSGTNGGFTHGTTVYQNGTAIGTVNNVGNPAFTSPVVLASSLVEIVLPANRRTQLVNGATYFTYPTFATYNKGDGVLSGEDLVVIANDTIREANIDYTETFGGPKGKIRIDRDLPANTRMRFRTLGTVGSPVHSSGAGIIDLQASYSAGNTINTSLSNPVTINATGADTALALTGSMTINGSGAAPLNGIFGSTDQNFVIGKESNKPSDLWTAKQSVKTHANWTGSAWSSKTAVQVTTNSSPTVVSNSGITMDTSTALRVCMTAVGRSNTNTGYASYRVEGMFKREAGNVIAIGSPVSTIIAQDGDGTATSLVFGIMNPDTVVAIIIGHGSNQYNWAVTLEWQAVKNSA
ncbi:MAG: hypothetical protein EBU90_06440 [Proteobacteria bacterium]|nr:hypothetical protein [Pseudomonadota bacterium]NBP13556.1 hypothetical protein [bacterium]